jgi:hypothetical protein
MDKKRPDHERCQQQRKSNDALDHQRLDPLSADWSEKQHDGKGAGGSFLREPRIRGPSGTSTLLACATHPNQT